MAQEFRGRGRPKGEAKGVLKRSLPLDLAIRVMSQPNDWLERLLRDALAQTEAPAPEARAAAVAALPALQRSIAVVAVHAERAKADVRVEPRISVAAPLGRPAAEYGSRLKKAKGAK